MRNKPFIIILSLLIVLVIAGGVYAYVFLRTPKIASPALGQNPGPFTPFGNTNAPATTSPSNTVVDTTPTPDTTGMAGKLAMLSATPVGGYGLLSTKTSTTVRFVDRGRGNVVEVTEGNNPVVLSNTVVPMMYETAWNGNLNAFIAATLQNSGAASTILYAQLQPRSSTSTASTDGAETVTPYTLKGRNLPAATVTFAASPKRDKIFTFTNEDGKGVGYISNFDGTASKRLFETPLTQVNVEWPEDTTITITTKGTAHSGGFMYFVNAKTGVWKKMLGPVSGLSTRTSHDLKYVLFSQTGPNQNIITNILNVARQVTVDGVVRTLADKCAWGNSYKNLIYCAVPSQISSGTYPDDWYMGTVSFSDKIWQVNASTGEVKQVSSITDQSDRLIDAFKLGLDQNDSYLLFMNKNDLTLWSLNLTSAN